MSPETPLLTQIWVGGMLPAALLAVFLTVRKIVDDRKRERAGKPVYDSPEATALLGMFVIVLLPIFWPIMLGIALLMGLVLGLAKIFEERDS